MTTTTRITLEHLGSSAVFGDAIRFKRTLSAACEIDARIESYSARFDVEQQALIIELTGTVSAHDFADEVYNLQHGTW